MFMFPGSYIIVYLANNITLQSASNLQLSRIEDMHGRALPLTFSLAHDCIYVTRVNECIVGNGRKWKLLQFMDSRPVERFSSRLSNSLVETKQNW